MFGIITVSENVEIVTNQRVKDGPIISKGPLVVTTYRLLGVPLFSTRRVTHLDLWTW